MARRAMVACCGGSDSRRIGLPILLVGSILLFGSSAAAECPLSGRIRGGAAPLPDAAIEVKQQGQIVASERSMADGRYTLTFEELPDRVRAVTVSVQKTGFTTDRRNLVRVGDSRCPSISSHDVDLEPDSDAAPADYSGLGLTIYIAPFEVYGEDSEQIARRINRQIPDFVHHGILAYASRIGGMGAGVDISVESFEEPLRPRQGEKIRRAGHRLNALGVVAGDGEIEGAGTDRRVELTSVFRTIPQYRDQALNFQSIRDSIPAREASPSRIGRGLQDIWGKQAVISVVLRRLSAGSGHWEQQELDELRDLLIDVRGTMDTDDPLLSSVQDLLTIVEEESR